MFNEVFHVNPTFSEIFAILFFVPGGEFLPSLGSVYILHKLSPNSKYAPNMAIMWLLHAQIQIEYHVILLIFLLLLLKVCRTYLQPIIL